MKKTFDVAVVMPVGPNTPLQFVTDTIESFLFYTASSYKIILADDSHQGIGRQVQECISDVDVLVTPRPMGGWAGLYVNEANAYRHALNNYQFKVLLKLDTDALIINAAPEKEAIALFEKDPTLGLAGQYPTTYHGEPWDIGWPRDRILNGATTWRYIRRPITNWYLRSLYKKALVHQYRAGESVFGGAYFMSYACLQALYNAGLLPDNRLRGLNMGEDHIFAIAVKSVGYHLGSLSGPGEPVALAWKGLPAPPEQLYNEGRKIIHSTRHWADMNEQDIRAYYARIRSGTKAARPNPTLVNNG